MYSAAVMAEIPEWNERKQSQWDRIAPSVVDGVLHGPCIELVRFGEKSSSFMLTCNSPDFNESIIFGQLPQIVMVPISKQRKELREADDSEKPLDKRRIDLTDAQIDAVLAIWSAKQTAASLDFIQSVWRDGKEYGKTAAQML